MSDLNIRLDQLKILLMDKAIKVISFDIFDTLLVRPVYAPTDVLYFLKEKAKLILKDSNIDFYKIRLAAENEARNELGKINPSYGEITLDNIYDHIASKYNISKENKIILRDTEINIETKLLKTRKVVKEIYDLAIASGKKVILISDFYMGKKVLEKILSTNNINNYHDIYVSSDWKKRKDTEKLYEIVLHEENIQPSEMLHIGDNYNSDVICSQNVGIVAFHLPSNFDIFFSHDSMHKEIWKDAKSYTPSERIILGICINKIAEDILEKRNYSDTFSSKFMLGYYGIGPFVFSLSHYILHDQNIQSNYSNFNFASRDGYLPKIIYDMLRNGNEKYLDSCYLYCGRQAYDVSYYDGDVFKYLSRKSNHTSKYTLANLFDAVVEKNFLKNKYQDKWPKKTYFNIDKKNNFVKLRTIIKKHEKEIQRILNRRKKLVEEYYNSSIQLNANNRAIIFDVGYSGSVSEGISAVSNGKVDKVYLWQTPKNEKSDEKNKTLSIVLCGYQDQINEKPPIFLAIEELFSPLEQTCVGFERNNNGIILPSFENDGIFSRSMRHSLREIQKGAISFGKDVISILGTYVHSLQFQIIEKFINPLTYSFSSPTDRSIHLLKDIVFSDSFSRNHKVSLHDKIEEKNSDYFQRTKFLSKELIHSSNQTKFAENKLKIGIHLHLFNIDQSFDFVQQLKDAPYKFDLLISVVDEKSKKIAGRYFNQNTLLASNQIIIKVFPNRGRDVAPWLVGFKKELNSYDVVCHLHAKKSSHFSWGNSWNNYLIKNLISPVAFNEIINYFIQNKNIGVIFPPIYKEIYKFWVQNSFSHLGLDNLLEVCKILLQKMGIRQNLDRDSVYFSVGNMFWYRTKAMTPLFKLNLKFDDFPEEPIPVDGTIAHAIERLHTIIADDQGYQTISYINQDELISHYHKNVMVDVLDGEDYKNQFQKSFSDLLYMHLEQERYFDAVLLAFRIYRDNFINEYIQKSTLLIQKKVSQRIAQDGWTSEKSKKLIADVESSLLNKEYKSAKNILDVLLNYEPMHLEALKHLVDISIYEKKYYYAAELNNLILSIEPNKTAIKNKKLLDQFVKTSNSDMIKTSNIPVKELDTLLKKEMSSSTDYLVSILIITYNQYSFTKKCMESILSHTTINKEIIIIDNASSDKTPAEIKKNYPQVKIYSNAENAGFPKAVNQGIKESNGKYILLLNNDTVTTKGWLERMLEVAESDDKIGIVGPISNAVSGVQLDKDAKYPDIKSMHEYARTVKNKNSGKIEEFPRVAFLCTLIKKEVIEKIGGLDERFSPGNYEDDDFCLRAQLAGYKTVIAKDVFIHHYGSKSFTADGEEKYRERLEINRNKFVEKWGGTPEDIWLKGKQIKGRNIMITLNKNEFVENIERALPLIEEKDYTNALQLLNNAIGTYDKYDHEEHDLDLTYLLNLAGNISLLAGYVNGARSYFEKALNLDTSSSLACSGLGDVLFIEGSYEAAKTMYEWGVKNNPENKAAVEGLAKVNKVFNYPEDDISLSKKKEDNEIDADSAETKPDTEKLMQEAYSFFNEKDFESALSKLTLAERLFNGQLSNPTNIDFAVSFHNMKGFVYLGLNDTENAKACFEKALNLDSNSSQACAGLGEVLYLFNHDKQAKAMFEWAVKNNPNNLFAVGGLKKVNNLLGYPDNHSSLDVHSGESPKADNIVITHRDDLGKLFNKLGLLGKGVEIGVQEGVFSQTLRSSWNGEELYLIDRWKYDPEYKDIANISDAKQKEYYLSVVQKFSEDNGVQILRKDSLSAAKQFPDEYFDWIYIDADHSFEGCSKDLEAWYPKLKTGGVMAGHDYIDGEFTAGSFGVKSAVDNFVMHAKVKLFITEETYWKSWYFIKPDPANEGMKLQSSQISKKMSDADSQKLISMLNEILEASFDLFGLKYFDESIDTLKKVENLFYAQKSKDLISAYENLLGFNYLALEKKKLAKESFETALNINPDSSQACAGLGELFYLDGKDKEAKSMYEYAVKNNPDNLFAVSGLEKVNKLLGLAEDNNSMLQ